MAKKRKRRKARRPKPAPPKPATVDDLTPKERLFAEHYCKNACTNAAQSYVEAGYKVKNMDVAGACAARLLARARVSEAVKARVRDLAAKVQLTSEETWQQLKNIVCSDISDVFDFSNGTPVVKLASQIPVHALQAIASWEQWPDGRIKIRFYDKGPQIVTAMKALGILKDKVEITGKDGKPLAAAGPTVVFYIPDNGRGPDDIATGGHAALEAEAKEPAAAAIPN